MQKSLSNYKNNGLSVTPDNIHLHISMLFDKAAILLVQSAAEKENKEFEAYAVSIQKAIKILTSLVGILDPNDTEAIQSGAPLKPNPWDSYFASVFLTINEITLKNNKSKLHTLEKSLKDAAKLWKNAGNAQPNGASSHALSAAPSLEMTLTC